ncbi:MAG: hypothetical protein DI551_06795 [Micavibrio aeruginosavorus]|uniref:Lipoprotein n=1 Tax=Micavibrio aeruginosavorus TaxID=349221 RepID=A0A2W5Q2T1_9BACT|nr:MAG: hypothetical protein DI551_06795 [Micavibrio aeruginosavorus]
MKNITSKFVSAAALVGTGAMGLASCGAPADHREKEQAVAKSPAVVPVCQIEADLRTSTVTLDFAVMIKNEANSVRFPLPTACPNIKSLSEGDSISGGFRQGSFLATGSLSGIDLSVKSVPENMLLDDKTRCAIQLDVRESHISLDITDHLKDSLNKQSFNWEVSKPVYDQLKVGQDLVKDGFKAGSFLARGVVSSWHVDVSAKRGCAPAVG